MEEKELDVTAELANLHLSGNERAAFDEEVGRILEYFELMKGIDVDGVEATTHVGVRGNRTRPDQVRKEDLSQGVLANAPDRQERFFRIPKVLG
jgi:aspartyl-tRNA(Asn)/glutamyl-tRNA(Gln) amidotransferase subunit C